MKTKAVFVCQSCGFHSAKWLGRCPSCGEWNSLIEEIEEEIQAEYAFPPSKPIVYKEIKGAEKRRIHTGVEHPAPPGQSGF